MKIYVSKKIGPPPPRNYSRREDPEDKKEFEKAIKALSKCEVNMHVRFTETEDRTRLNGIVASMFTKYPDRRFTVCRLEKTVFGIWRIR